MSIIDFFNKRVLETPEKTCLFSKDKKYTFRELEIFSDNISQAVCEKSNSKIVPIYINNDINVLPVVLGIIKSGKIPLPLSNSYSLEQSLLRITDINYDLIVTDTKTSVEACCKKVFECDSELYFWEKSNTSNSQGDSVSDCLENVSYVICTSGSTGIPKKVLLSESNIVWLLNEYYRLVSFSNDSKFLFTTPYTFDVSITEIFAPIFTGGELYCFSRDMSSVEKMRSTLDYIEEYGITHLSLSPTYAELLFDINPLEKWKGLKYLCLAGEKFEITLAKKLSSLLVHDIQVLNLYGPSETTIYATYYFLTGNETNVVPIGQPFEGCYCMVLDEFGNESNYGELFIGGSGVSLGYLLQSELTKEKFVTINSKKFYSTGDFVFTNEQGELIFDCRKDSQVQINGIRIELGEVESLIQSIPEVKICKCIYSNKKLYAFYQVYNAGSDVGKKLEDVLPNYLKPVLIEVEEFLLNQNRKFDSKGMLEKYCSRLDSNPLSGIKEILQEILIFLEIDHYEYMDSIDVVRFFVEVEEKFKIDVGESDILGLSSLDKVENYIQDKLLQYSNNIGKDENQASVIEQSPEYYDNLKTNLSLQISRYFRMNIFEEEQIPTLYMQKHYHMKGYDTVLSFDCSYSDFTYKGMRNLEDKISILSNCFDILKMVLFFEDENLFFKKIKSGTYIPFIYISNDLLSEKIVKDILYDLSLSPQFFIVAYPNQQKITFYFSHYIIDKSSLYKLSREVSSFLEDNNLSQFESSYESFIKYIKKSTETISVEEIYQLIPETKFTIPTLRERSDQRLMIMESKLHSEEPLDVTLEAIYKYSKYIFRISNDIEEITGSMIVNIREFVDYDADNLIGDIHSTVPFCIKRMDSVEEFKDRQDELIALYEKGVNIRDKIYEAYPEYPDLYKQMKDRWESLNTSFNYLGEINNIDKFLKEIKEVHFNRKYVIVFTKKSRLFLVIMNNSLLPSHFEMNCSNGDKVSVYDYLTV